MNLQDYKWSHNPRGLHNEGPFKPFFVQRYTLPQLGWAKLTAGADEYCESAQKLLANQVTPIIRIFRESMSGLPAPGDWWSYYKSYIDVGCLWFELYNEPNLEEEWPRQSAMTPIDWANREGCITPLVDAWLEWAEGIVDLGGYPAFPAFAESTAHRQATVYWLDACLQYLKDQRRNRFMHVLANGLWCATHPYLQNHFYQEPPGGPARATRPYYQQQASDSGWHFEYPYDPISQKHDPGRTVFGGTTNAPYGDPYGLIAVGEAFQQLLKKYFRAGPVPVVGTQGGILQPSPGESPRQPDKRYPPYTLESHTEATLAMWQWIAHMGPPWFFGLTLSDEYDYYEKLEGPAPVIKRMIDEAPVLKEIPQVETTGAAMHQWPPRLPDLTSDEPHIVVEDLPRPPEDLSSSTHPANEHEIIDGVILTPPPPMQSEDQPVDDEEAKLEIDVDSAYYHYPELTAQSSPESEPDEVEAQDQPLSDAELLELLGAPQGVSEDPTQVVNETVLPLPASMEPPVEQASDATVEMLDTDTFAEQAPLLVSDEQMDYWVLLAPEIPLDWFFDAGVEFWQRFSPTVSTAQKMIQLLPPTSAITVLAIESPKSSGAVISALADVFVNATIERIIVASHEELQAELHHYMRTLLSRSLNL